MISPDVQWHTLLLDWAVQVNGCGWPLLGSMPDAPAHPLMITDWASKGERAVGWDAPVRTNSGALLCVMLFSSRSKPSWRGYRGRQQKLPLWVCVSGFNTRTQSHHPGCVVSKTDESANSLHLLMNVFSTSPSVTLCYNTLCSVVPQYI